MKKALESTEILRLLKRIRKIVNHFIHSTLAKAALKDKQKERNKSVKVLIMDCKTRWNSSYDMIERFTELTSEVYEVLCQENNPMVSINFIFSLILLDMTCL